MKRAFLWRLGLVVTMAAMIVCGATKSLCADNPEHGPLNDRLDQLERRVNELAEHQHPFMQRPGAMLQRMEKIGPPGAEMARPSMLPGLPMHLASVPAAPRCPLRGMCCGCPIFLVALLLLASVINILIAVWIYTDIRKRGEGPGIFIALALIAGIPTAIIYALVRIGDKKS